LAKQEPTGDFGPTGAASTVAGPDRPDWQYWFNWSLQVLLDLPVITNIVRYTSIAELNLFLFQQQLRLMLPDIIQTETVAAANFMVSTGQAVGYFVDNGGTIIRTNWRQWIVVLGLELLMVLLI